MPASYISVLLAPLTLLILLLLLVSVELDTGKHFPTCSVGCPKDSCLSDAARDTQLPLAARLT